MSTIDVYAVMGNPIAHSLSPMIHQQFADLTQQAMYYEKRLVALDGFDDAVKEFFQQGGKGLNVTLPFKQQAFAIADVCNERAQQAGAVNTLSINAAGQLQADNTDGIGLVTDLIQHCGLQLNGKSILLLGAGGAARGVVAPLLAKQPRQLHIANRNVDKARALFTQFHADVLSASDLHTIPEYGFDIIINATASSVHKQTPELSPAVVTAETVTYDMFYAAEATAFQSWSRQHGALAAYDGLGMLVEQAAEAFFIWRGVRPPTQVVIEACRQYLF